MKGKSRTNHLLHLFRTLGPDDRLIPPLEEIEWLFGWQTVGDCTSGAYGMCWMCEGTRYDAGYHQGGEED